MNLNGLMQLLGAAGMGVAHGVGSLLQPATPAKPIQGSNQPVQITSQAPQNTVSGSLLQGHSPLLQLLAPMLTQPNLGMPQAGGIQGGPNTGLGLQGGGGEQDLYLQPQSANFANANPQIQAPYQFQGGQPMTNMYGSPQGSYGVPAVGSANGAGGVRYPIGR